MPATAAKIKKQSRQEYEDATHTVWISISDMRFDPRVNRVLRQSRVDEIAANFDADKLGIIHLSKRDDGTYVVIEGQHRVRALVQMGWQDQRMEARVYEGLSVAQEAELMLALNDKLTLSSLDGFLIAVNAEDPEAVTINNIVNAAGLVVDNQLKDGSVTAVGALQKIYRGEASASAGNTNPEVLAATLDIAIASWGKSKAAVNGSVLNGIGLLLHRYGDLVDRDVLVQKLGAIPGGPSGLLGRAKALREIRGSSVPRNVAATVVEVYNKSRRQGALSNWWAS